MISDSRTSSQSPLNRTPYNPVGFVSPFRKNQRNQLGLVTDLSAHRNFNLTHFVAGD